MAKKTATALVPQKVTVGEFDDDGDATTCAMRVLQAENARLTEQVQTLHVMLTSMHKDTIDDRRATRNIMLEFEKAHVENIKLREDWLDRKDERKSKRDAEKQQEKMLQDAFSLLQAHAPELIGALKRRGQPAQAEEISLDALRKYVVEMPREERALMLEVLLKSLEAEAQPEEKPDGSH